MSAILRQALALVVLLLRTLLYGWIVALVRLILVWWGRLRSAQRRHRLPDRLGKADPGHCVRVSDPAYKRPDPMIYDQYYLMSLGLGVTWDNPDIVLLDGGVPVADDTVKPDTEYEIAARIWNGSTEAPVVGLPVSFSYLSFGVGTVSHPIGDTKVDLGVKGGPGCPANATMTWRTPTTPGHYCVQVQFAWPDDLNPANNLGQENLQVGTAHSPATFEFALRNDTDAPHTYRLEADGYTIPELPPCDQLPATSPRDGGVRYMLDVQATHRREAHPVPEGWSVTFAPAEPTLRPGDETAVTVDVTPPDTFHGRQPINVHAFHEGVLAGGVTLYAERA
jgi:hypothetical protein